MVADWRSFVNSGKRFGDRRSICWWEEFPEGGPGHFQEGKSGSSVCLVPGGFDCFDPGSALYRLFHESAPGSRKRAWDQDQDAGEAGGEAVDYGLDVDEKEGAF
jgi:hypothetical protein